MTYEFNEPNEEERLNQLFDEINASYPFASKEAREIMESMRTADERRLDLDSLINIAHSNLEDALDATVSEWIPETQIPTCFDILLAKAEEGDSKNVSGVVENFLDTPYGQTASEFKRRVKAINLGSKIGKAIIGFSETLGSSAQRTGIMPKIQREN